MPQLLNTGILKLQLLGESLTLQRMENLQPEFFCKEIHICESHLNSTVLTPESKL